MRELVNGVMDTLSKDKNRGREAKYWRAEGSGHLPSLYFLPTPHHLVVKIQP